VSVNFDAKLSLDVSQFLSGVKKAEGALKSLEAQIGRINSRNLSLGAGGGALGASAGTSISRRRAEAALEQSLVEKMTKTEMNNAKVQWQAEMMRQKSMDSRLRDHQTISSLYDQEIAREQKSRREASNAIRTQMQEREQMNKLHARANAMNARFDAARANQSQAALRGIARERYALYDVAAAYAAVTAASVATVTAVVGTAAQYERAFANVIRTADFTSIKVGEAARVMRFELMQLANEIPVTFGQITEIATIGNQLGIAQADLVNFTDTVAKFAATTDVTIQNAAMSFGRIGELLDEGDFNKLGSAIAFAGVNAVATETQILSVTREIATTAKQAKFTTPEVIGLATALSSLGIAPEAARGSIIRSFAAINAAITKGGSDLEAYASIAGMTADQFASTWQEKGSTAFDALLKGLQAASDGGQNLDSVLRSLGVRNVRDIQTLQKLGDNYDVYTQSINDANKAFKEGTFLSEAYGVIQETVASKLGVVQNQVNNLLAGLGESTTGPVKELLNLISTLLTRLQQFAANPAGQAVTTIVVGLLAAAAAVAALNTVVALGRAAMLAYATAMGTAVINAEGLVVGLNRAATAAKILGVVTKTIGIGIAITAVTSAFAFLGDEIQKVTDRAGYFQRKAEELVGGFGGLQDAITKDIAAMKESAAQSGLTLEQYARTQGAIVVNTEAVRANNAEIDNAITAQETLGIIIGEQPDAITGTNEAVESQTLIVGENTQAWIKNAIASSDAFKEITKNAQVGTILEDFGYNFEDALRASFEGRGEQYFNQILDRYRDSLNKLKAINPFDWAAIVNAQNAIGQIEKVKDAFLGITVGTNLLGLGPELAESLGLAGDNADELDDEISGVSKSLRTVLDYANDLRGVLQRVSDIKLNRQLVKDDIAEGWEDIAEKATDAEEAIRDANAEIQELTADRGVLEYQLAVAQRYGDEKRAAILRAKLAKIDNQMADAQDDLKEAQDESNKSLKGNTRAARENRQELAGMVDKYQDYIVALVESGLKGKALADAIDTLKRQFREQALAAGYAEDELKPYLETFDGFKETVEKMPRNVDIEFNSNISAAQQALNEYTAKLKALNGTGVTTTVTQKQQVVISTPAYALKIPVEDAIRIRRAYDRNLIDYRELMKSLYGAVVDQFGNFVVRAQGGPVFGPGSSTSDSIPAMLSNGEYVVRAKAVKAYGLDFMNSINQMKPISSMGGLGGGVTAGAGVTIAQLSPEDRALLRAAVDRPINLYADSKKIAQTANDGNNLIARRGVR